MPVRAVDSREMFDGPLMDRCEVAAWAGVAPQTVDVWARGITIKGVKLVLESVQLPGQRKYTRAALERFVEACRVAREGGRDGAGVQGGDRFGVGMNCLQFENDPLMAKANLQLALYQKSTKNMIDSMKAASAKEMARRILKDGTGAGVRDGGRGLNLDTLG